jgi:branched-chain amino acid transport system permease protein
MVLKPLFGNIDGLPYVFTGVLIILVVMFYPSGVKGLGDDLSRLFRFIKRKIGKGKESEENG